MGLKPSQGELNAALTPIFSHINGVHLIHDDVVIATSTNDEHLKAVKLVLQAVVSHSIHRSAYLQRTRLSFGE